MTIPSPSNRMVIAFQHLAFMSVLSFLDAGRLKVTERGKTGQSDTLCHAHGYDPLAPRNVIFETGGAVRKPRGKR